MSGVQLPFVPKFEQSERIKVLEARNQELALSGVRQLGTYGDHRCWIDIGPFPHMDKVPPRWKAIVWTASCGEPIMNACWIIRNRTFIPVRR